MKLGRKQRGVCRGKAPAWGIINVLCLVHSDRDCRKRLPWHVKGAGMQVRCGTGLWNVGFMLWNYSAHHSGYQPVWSYLPGTKVSLKMNFSWVLVELIQRYWVNTVLWEQRRKSFPAWVWPVLLWLLSPILFGATDTSGLCWFWKLLKFVQRGEMDEVVERKTVFLMSEEYINLCISMS